MHAMLAGCSNCCYCAPTMRFSITPGTKLAYSCFVMVDRWARDCGADSHLVKCPERILSVLHAPRHGLHTPTGPTPLQSILCLAHGATKCLEVVSACCRVSSTQCNAVCQPRTIAIPGHGMLRTAAVTQNGPFQSSVNGLLWRIDLRNAASVRSAPVLLQAQAVQLAASRLYD